MYKLFPNTVPFTEIPMGKEKIGNAYVTGVFQSLTQYNLVGFSYSVS